MHVGEVGVSGEEMNSPQPQWEPSSSPDSAFSGAGQKGWPMPPGKTSLRKSACPQGEGPSSRAGTCRAPGEGM